MIKKLRWQILVVVVTLLVVAVLLFTPEPGQQVFSPKPAEGGVYTEGLVGSLSRLNPLLDQNNSADRDINRLLFASLVTFDARGLPLPGLADSWGVSQDGTIYNFSIRPSAVWHDGTPVSVADIIFTIDLIKSDSSLFPADVREMWKLVEIKKLNDKTVQFVLPEPFAPFLDYLTFGLLPKHILDGTPADQLAASAFNLAPVGSGPYRFERLIVENGQVAGVELRAFDKYFGHKAFIDQVIFRYYPNASAALDAYRQGQVLAISQITPDILPQALAEPALNLYTGRLPELSLVMFNLNNPEVPFLQDAKMRRALLVGLNRQQIVDKLLAGQAIVADGPLFPGTWAYYEKIEHLNYDPTAAISLLKSAEYKIPAAGGDIRENKDGLLLELSLLYPDDSLHASIAQLIQTNWAQLGVKVNLEALPYDSLVNDRLVSRNYQVALIDLNLMRSPDPDPYPFWHQSEITGGQNYSQWDNRTASEYIEQARVTPDFNARARLYRNFQVIFSKELPALPLYFPVYSYGVSETVRNAQMPPLFDTSDRFLTIADWYLVTRRALDQTSQPTP
ncbi:MAG: peptide ABC transporter substrate-binding protein [Chloroflexi bacterium]|nr:peptide ABC transporter substrate-binding protein [Chloroflexota bacterium]